jgi:hypothetical protein
MTLNTLAAEAAKPAPIEIALDETKALLARAVKERGADYTYKMLTIADQSLCAYFDPVTKAPSCIVGQVLAYKGVTFDDMFAQDKNVYASAGTLIDTKFIKADNETRALLEIVQSEQDAGMPWGLAVEEALETYEDAAKRYEEDGRANDPSEDYWF